MKRLLITDLHLNSRVPGLLDAQVECLCSILGTEQPDEVIVMGDVFMHRKPSPRELLGFGKFIDKAYDELCAKVCVLRGNHDSENKSDDGITALSVYKDKAKIVTQTWFDYKTKRAFIPHYENEDTIKEALARVPKDYTVFGHFGYAGCLNSAGDYDFSLGLDNFNNTTYLGHIHKFSQKGKVTILGTPYSTNYGESEKQNFYAILSDDSADFKLVTHGPRYVVIDYKDLSGLLDIINDDNYFTMLRVMCDPNDDPSTIPYDDLKVASIDIKFKPVFDKEDVTYSPSRDLFSINEVIVQDYIDSVQTALSQEQIMEGYFLIKDEDSENTN